MHDCNEHGRTIAYQAIVTRYLGPTNTKGSRVKATAEVGSITLSWDNACTDNHARAARALAAKWDWLDDGRQLVSGGLPNGDYVHVFADRKS